MPEEHKDTFQLLSATNTMVSKEPQEVVDKLLNSDLMSSSQSKPALDNLQNCANSTHSQTKGKERERGDRSSKTEDDDSGSITKLTEKGCLVSYESVEKLVEFIQPNRIDKKLDLITRSMVASVIASTDRFDCLCDFVHLKGLAVLDEWLQDVHKGRIFEVNGLKDGEKNVEDFLLVLLRALDKLPVNLHALQTCNIGRSVNRLRSHRNIDIQRKARNLVDIWKKRVEAEMNVLDSKSGSKKESSQPRTVPYSGSDVLSNNSSHSFPGNMNTNKSSNGSSRHRRSSNGFFGTSVNHNKETLNRNEADEKTFEVPAVETSSHHKLIVKIPNRIEPARDSPAQSASVPSSPVLSNILESDHNMNDKSEDLDSNNDHKDLKIESNDLEAARDEDQSNNVDGKAKEFLESSTSALNILIESCVKYESNVQTTSSGDDIGMNLLASVATREMCTFQDEKNCFGDDSKPKEASLDDKKINSEDNEIRDDSKPKEASLDDKKINSEDNEIHDTSRLDDVFCNANSNCDADVEAKPTDDEPVGPSVSDKEGTKEHVFMEETTATSTTTVNGARLSDSGQLGRVSIMDFDLNEGLSGQLEYSVGLLSTTTTTNVPSAIKVAAKGRFVPPFDLLRNKGEIGWKGSATTSAFRPVEPRKPTQMIGTSKPCRVQFDFDLNVADERLLEDSSTNIVNNEPLSISHYGGLDLDLNRIDDSSNKRDFDLNSGPGSDDVVAEHILPHHPCGVGTLSMNSVSPVFGLRPNILEPRNFSVGPFTPDIYRGPLLSSSQAIPFPSGMFHFGTNLPLPSSSSTVYSVGPNILEPRNYSVGPFMPDMYRGSLLSPSQAIPFPSGMFLFGTNLPLPSSSTTYSVGSASTSNGRHLNSQFLAPVNEISSQYPKKYMFEGRQGFDLNAGPGVPEVEGQGREVLAQRQLYVSGSDPTADSVLKRKEPEAGFDRENLRYKQSSWH